MAAPATADLAQLAHAYGLQTGRHACHLWGVRGCQPHEVPVHLALWRLIGTLSAARHVLLTFQLCISP